MIVLDKTIYNKRSQIINLTAKFIIDKVFFSEQNIKFHNISLLLSQITHPHFLMLNESYIQATQPLTLSSLKKQCSWSLLSSFLRMIVDQSVIADQHSESEFHIRYRTLGDDTDDLILVTHQISIVYSYGRILQKRKIWYIGREGLRQVPRLTSCGSQAGDQCL